MAAGRIPYDVIREIVGYVPDIDVRRSFGVYGKLDVRAHEPVISSVLPIGNEVKSSRGDRQYIRYKLRNLETFPKRAEQYVEDDMLEVIMTIQESFVEIQFSIFRLKAKEGESRKELVDMFYKGDTDDYYWDYVESDHVRW